MNTNFEHEFKGKPSLFSFYIPNLTLHFLGSEFAQSKGAYHKENFDFKDLKDFTIALDADLLLSKVTNSNALKTLQDGHSSSDVAL